MVLDLLSELLRTMLATRVVTAHKRETRIKPKKGQPLNMDEYLERLEVHVILLLCFSLSSDYICLYKNEFYN